MSTRTRLAAVLMAVAVAVTGCGFKGMHDVPLPGGADVGANPYRVTAHFADVLDLVQQSDVKVNDVAVGRVERIEVAPDGWTAEATLLINDDIRLPRNATAQLVQSSLLGEKFVQLAAPAKPRGTLRDGDTIDSSRTDRYPEVEEILGALAMLLSGGGIDQIRTISREVNTALSGNEAQIRSLLSNLDQFVGQLDDQRGDITDALTGLNRLSKTLAAQRDTIDTTLTDLEPGIKVLAAQRKELRTMLRSLDTLSGVATDTIERSREDMIADLKALAPTLRKLSQAGKHLPRSLEVLLTFPFTDASMDVIRGDYTNIDVKLQANLDVLLSTLTAGASRSSYGADGSTRSPGSAGPPAPNPSPDPPLPLTGGSGSPELLGDPMSLLGGGG
ncbi:MCE family protein [Haloechinothrix halophila]|uniref:MCE family protein n=1 Tax=Haloechinothrix halophila TaxID=1069073 RepID=UPI00041C125C|nr:MCE family protein [Haloechinothrix halophila]